MWWWYVCMYVPCMRYEITISVLHVHVLVALKFRYLLQILLFFFFSARTGIATGKTITIAS